MPLNDPLLLLHVDITRRFSSPSSRTLMVADPPKMRVPLLTRSAFRVD
jgi:hypothetical protein